MSMLVYSVSCQHRDTMTRALEVASWFMLDQHEKRSVENQTFASSKIP